MSRPLVALALAGLVAGCADAPLAPAPLPTAAPIGARAAGAPAVSGQYLVLLRESARRGAPGTLDGDAPATIAAVAAAKVGGSAAAVRRTFAHVVRGFAAQLSDSAVAALRADPEVALVEPDPVMHADGVQSGAPWGLDRIDQPALPLDGSYRYPGDGSGVTVYIVDSGINFAHADFGGRAAAGVDYVTNGGGATDCAGHGTHVAGTVGGSTYGVAKGVRLVAMRVLDCSGSGSGSAVIAALDYVVQQKQAAPSTPVVVNMSIGGAASSAIDEAVASAVASGVTVVVAAGNSAADACSASPARAADAITVGATDGSDRLAAFSNYGSCVDLLAPGVGVVSDYVGGNTATATLSGTSMASPHVAGAAALYLALHPSATPAQVAGALAGNAVAGGLSGLPAGTPQRLLNVAFIGGAAPVAPSYVTNAASGLCLSARGSAGLVSLSGCAAGNTGQQWNLPVASATAAMTPVSIALCLDGYGGTGAVGDAVGTWTCLGGQANQRWALSAAGELTGINGLCVAAPTTSGGTLTLQACNGSPAQRWTTSTTVPTPVQSALVTPLQNVGSSLCMDVSGASQTRGTQLIIWTCNGQLNQRWTVQPRGTAGAVTVYGSLCLDDAGGNGTDGDAIVTWSCHGGVNQQWTLGSDGSLRGIGGKCVAVKGGSTGGGAALVLMPCTGGPEQRWLPLAGG